VKRAITIAAMLAAAGLAGAQMFAQLFGGSAGTPIPAVAWYKLDGNALDSSGNGYDGTWSGTEGYEAGKFAGTQAGAFDATNLVTRATDANITQALTITAWVKSAGNTDPFPRIAVSENRWGLYLNTTSPLGTLFFYGSGVNTRFPSSDDTLYDDAWHHVACVYDGDGIDGYIDAASVGTIAKTGDLAAQSGTPITIGNRADGTRGLNGNVQDVRIFRCALSPANIARIMESQDNEPLEELQ